MGSLTITQKYTSHSYSWCLASDTQHLGLAIILCVWTVKEGNTRCISISQSESGFSFFPVCAEGLPFVDLDRLSVVGVFVIVAVQL